jgi:hypothetical protein
MLDVVIGYRNGDSQLLQTMKCLTYLRTSGDDGKESGLPVQREACGVRRENGYEIIAGTATTA